jgi:hypothetical protein
MSKRIVEAFFNTFNEFIDQLIVLFPDDPDFPAYKSGLGFLKMGNPSIIFDQIERHVIPHEDLILKKNDDFFVKYDFDDIVAGDSSMSSVIESLKSKWLSLPLPTRSILFDYLILLTNLAKTYAAK